MKCECLAAWLDNEPCICNEPIGHPMEVSAEKLARANQLVREVREIDRALQNILRDKPFCRTIIYYGSQDQRVEVRLPHDLAYGVLKTMRFQTLIKLSQTGVTSMASGHRPVVSA